MQAQKIHYPITENVNITVDSSSSHKDILVQLTKDTCDGERRGLEKLFHDLYTQKTIKEKSPELLKVLLDIINSLPRVISSSCPESVQFLPELPRQGRSRGKESTDGNNEKIEALKAELTRLTQTLNVLISYESDVSKVLASPTKPQQSSEVGQSPATFTTYRNSHLI